MNNTETTFNATATPVADAPVMTPATPAEPSADVAPELDTLELIRHDPGTAPEPDPSDTFLTHRRTSSIWDLA